jgi:hypothetical protein
MELRQRFVISSLLPAPRLSFHNSNASSAYLQESQSQFAHTAFRSVSAQRIQLDLSKGVLTLDYCDQLLKDLIKCSDLSAFRQKVNAEQIPGYDDIIKHPMDLKTLQERLSSGLITTVSQFKRELDLIWDNCLTFNGPAHALSGIARDARRNIDQVWEESTHPGSSHAVEKLSQLQVLLDQLHGDMSTRIKIDPRPIIPPPKKIPKPLPRSATIEIAPPKVDLVPNHQQRKLIADILSRTSVTEMRGAWDLLKPYLDRDSRKKRLLSLNGLPDPILIELRKLVLP